MASVVDCDVSTPFGTTDEEATPVYQTEWGRLGQAFTGDGLIGETTTAQSGRWTFTASGSDTNVTITPNDAPGVIVAGFTGRITDAKTLDIDTDGAPGVGVRRLDWIVARLNRTTQKVQLAVVQGDPGAGILPSLETDRGGDAEVPLFWVDRTGPVNVTNAMITVASMRPSPGFFLGTAGGATARDAIGAPDGSLLIQGYNLYSRILSGSTMIWRDLGNPSWTNLTLPSGVVASSAKSVPQLRVRGGALELRGGAMKSSGTWTAGTPVTIATFNVSFRDLLGGQNWTRYRNAPCFTTPLPATTGSSGWLRIQMSDSGGALLLTPPASVSIVELDAISPLFPDLA